MAPTLQKLSRAHRRESTSPVGKTHKAPDGTTLRVDPAKLSARQLKRRRDIAKLKQIRGSLEELILLADAQDHLPRTENGHIPTRGAVRIESQQLLAQLRDMIGVKEPSNVECLPKPKSTEQKASPRAAAAKKKKESERESSKVQLRLSRALVRILIEFNKAGHSPNKITERSLWKDPGICDAAKILGISPPQLKKIVSSQVRQS